MLFTPVPEGSVTLSCNSPVLVWQNAGNAHNNQRAANLLVKSRLPWLIASQHVAALKSSGGITLSGKNARSGPLRMKYSVRCCFVQRIFKLFHESRQLNHDPRVCRKSLTVLRRSLIRLKSMQGVVLAIQFAMRCFRRGQRRHRLAHVYGVRGAA